MDTTGMTMMEREYEDKLACLRGEILKLTTERDKLQAFKDYVHGRLDAAGVPTDPDSPHKVEGCRIGGRLDWIMEQLGTALHGPGEEDGPWADGWEYRSKKSVTMILTGHSEPPSPADDDDTLHREQEVKPDAT